MFLSVFKEKTLDERIVRFFSKLESGKIKCEAMQKSKWTFDSIELTIDESKEDIRCYFDIDHRTIYILRYVKEIGESEIIVEREEYLIENGYVDFNYLKSKIIEVIRKEGQK